MLRTIFSICAGACISLEWAAKCLSVMFWFSYISLRILLERVLGLGITTFDIAFVMSLPLLILIGIVVVIVRMSR